jgi:hypothetical protein
MGHTTRISDYEMERGDGRGETEGVDIEASAAKSNAPKHHMSESEIRGDFTDPDEEEPKMKAKVVTVREKKPPVTTTAVAKSK